jgi:hypothetical protein
VRTGLVAVGTAFSVVGAAVIVGILYPGDDSTQTRVTTAGVDGLNGGNWKPFILPTSSSSRASLTLSWSASSGDAGAVSRLDVSLYSAYPCPSPTGACLDDPPLHVWNGTGTGHWNASGAGSMYVLYVDLEGASNLSANFTATFVETYATSVLPLPMLPFMITMVGGGLLTGVGAVGLYLGLFLPPGVYDRPDPYVPGELDPVPEGPDPADEPPDGSGPT